VKHVGSGVLMILDHFYEHDTKENVVSSFVYLALQLRIWVLATYDGEYLPLHTVQKVIGDILESLVNLAHQKIVHGFYIAKLSIIM
jgi:hypothetical protein